MGEGRRFVVFAPLVLGAVILAYVVNLREAHFGQVLQVAAGWTGVAVLVAMNFFELSRRPPWRYVFIVLAGVIAIRCLWWRRFETLIFTDYVGFAGMAALWLLQALAR